MHNPLDRKQVVSRLKPLCNNPDIWKAFGEYIDLEIQMQQSALEQADNMVVMHRAQGAIASLRRLKKLREEANGTR